MHFEFDVNWAKEREQKKKLKSFDAKYQVR